MARKSLAKTRKVRRRSNKAVRRTGKVGRKGSKSRRRTGKVRRRTGRIRRRSRKNRHGGQGPFSLWHDFTHKAKRQLGEWRQGNQLVSGNPHSLSVRAQQARAAEADRLNPITQTERGRQSRGYIMDAPQSGDLARAHRSRTPQHKSPEGKFD